MLTLNRSAGDVIVITDTARTHHLTISIEKVSHGRVVVGLSAASYLVAHRGELLVADPDTLLWYQCRACGAKRVVVGGDRGYPEDHCQCGSHNWKLSRWPDDTQHRPPALARITTPTCSTDGSSETLPARSLGSS
jgi:sRNA-binding carbon storage regulator CsrA